MNIIGADPGVPLYLSLFRDGTLIKVTEAFHTTTKVKASKGKDALVNDPEKIVSIIFTWLRAGETVIVSESAHPRPSDGIVSAAKYVGSYHMMHGIAAGMGIPFYSVSPVRWKKKLNLSQDKKASVEAARRLWPELGYQFTKVADHNKAEAALIAYWANKYFNFTTGEPNKEKEKVKINDLR